MGERTNALNETDNVEDTIEMPRNLAAATAAAMSSSLPPDDASLVAATADETNDVDALRADIENTRSEMTQTIDAIKEKLSPQHLVEEAKESVREAATERVGQAKEVVAETAVAALATAKEFADRAKETAVGAFGTAKGTAADALETAKEAVGGAVETLKDKVVDAKEKVTETVASAKESASGAVLSARDTVGDVVGSAGERAKSAGTAAVSTVRENPAPFALAGAGLGIAAGVYLLTRAKVTGKTSTGAPFPTNNSTTTQVSPIYPIEPPLTPVEEAAAERVARTAAAEIGDNVPSTLLPEGVHADRVAVVAAAVLVTGLAAYWVLRETRHH
jgi:ElaB/YqjD/DUF883 family membrane-anchored ribosome-binding protein